MNADALASLLVREGVLPHARVEEAQERQILAGGTLDSALLELGLLDEPKLLELLPRAYQAPAVGKSDLLGVDRAVTSVFPRRLAEKHGVVPIEVNGRRLTVALAGPPDLALLDEIGFMLSVYVKPAVTTQARVAWALARIYGVPLAPRMEALLQRAGESTDEAKAAVEAWQARAAHAPVDKPEPAASAAAPDTSGWTVGAHAGLDRSAPSEPRLTAEGGGSLQARAEAAEAAEKAVDPDEARDERRRRERVLWTVDDAIAELALAEDRDAMLDVVLRFGYRRLSTVAVFVLTRGGASGQSFVGWDVIDPLLGRKDVASFELPAEGKHGLGQVLEMRSPFLGPLKREDPLVRLFGRRARAVVLVPILVGDRFIGAFYGDCGARAIPPSSLAELHMVVPRLGKALGNLILRKKKALRAAARPPDTVVVGALVEDARAGAAAASAPYEAPDDVEESFAVSARAPARPMPTIDIDITEVDSFDELTAPSDLSSDPLPDRPAPSPGAEPDRGAAPSVPPAAAGPALRAWADGKDDDEDVRLDETAVADLMGEVSFATRAARIELGLDDVMPGDASRSGEGEPVGDELEPIDDILTQALISVPDGDVMPDPARARAPLPAEPGSVAPSPGVGARESLLVATHEGWLLHDDPVLDELVGQLHRPGEGPSQKKSAIAAVVAHGERALPSLARYFPGVLTVHPFGSMDQRPEVEATSDCLACLTRLGAHQAAPILAAELSHDDRLHRWTAVWALSALRVPGALPRLAQRLFDPEPAIASLALEVLEAYRAEPAFEKVLAQVRDLVRRGDAFERQRAIVAVAELRDRQALSSLVDLLGTRPKEIAEAARHALVEITKQDFGTSERRWRAWIADNANVPRTRWLIDGLSAKDDEIRRSAQAELNRITGQFFGYRWDAPRAEREQSVAQWQDWWQAQSKQAPGQWP